MVNSDIDSAISVPISNSHRSARRPQGILKRGRQQGARVLAAFSKPVSFRLPRNERPTTERTTVGDPDVVAVRKRGGFLRAFLFGAPRMTRERTDDYDEEDAEGDLAFRPGGMPLPEPHGSHLGTPRRAHLPSHGTPRHTPRHRPMPPLEDEDDIDANTAIPAHFIPRGSTSPVRSAHSRSGSARPARVVQLQPDIPPTDASDEYVPRRRRSQPRFNVEPPAPVPPQPRPAQPVRTVPAQPAQTIPVFQATAPIPPPQPSSAEHSNSPPSSSERRRRPRRSVPQSPRLPIRSWARAPPPPPSPTAAPQPDGHAPSTSSHSSRMARTLHDISNYPWVNRVTAEYIPGKRGNPSLFKIPDAVSSGGGVSSWYTAPQQGGMYAQSRYAPRQSSTGAPPPPLMTSHEPPPPQMREHARPSSLVSIPGPPVPPKSPGLPRASRQHTVNQAMVVFNTDGQPVLYAPPGTTIPQSPILLTDPNGQTMWYQPVAPPRGT